MPSSIRSFARQYRALFFTAGVLACMDSTGPGDGPVESGAQVTYQLSDAGSGGRSGFYFLPPIADANPPKGTLDRNLLSQLDIRICALPACASDIAVYTSSTVPNIKRDGNTSYSLDWKTKPNALNIDTNYRLRVYANTQLSGPVLLGFADIDVVRDGKAKKSVPDGFVGLVKDEKLDVKFRVEMGFVASIDVTPATSTKLVGETQTFTASVLDLHDAEISTATWSTSNPSVATITPTTGLNTTATGVGGGLAYIKAVSGGLADSAALTIVSEIAPTVLSTTPADLSTDVAIDTNIALTFSEPVVVTGEWFAIECPRSGNRNVAATGITGGPTTFTIDPAADFAPGETCTVTVNATQVTDVDSDDPPDAMASNHVFSFSTADVAPTITSTLPVDGAAGVAPSATVTVNFSESVNAAISSFNLSCSSSPVSFTLSSSPAASFTLTPTAPLPGGASCSVTVVSDQISDADLIDPPDNMASNEVIGFTVQVPNAGPDAKDDLLSTIVASTLNGDVNNDNGSGADDLGSPSASVASFGGGSTGGTVQSNAPGASVSLAGGTLTIATDGTISLTSPTTAGSYTVLYRLTNSSGSDDATVAIIVRKAPDAIDDAFVVSINGTLNGNVTSNNGSGADDLGYVAATVASFGGGSLPGDASTNSAGSSVSLAGGTLTIAADGAITLTTPTATGDYTVVYRLTNATGSDDATVTISVREATSAKDDAFSVDVSNNLAGNLFNDNGSGADNLGSPAGTLTSFGGGSLGGTVISNAAGASVSLAGGTLTVNANGTFSLNGATTAGTFTFLYRLTNSQGTSDATVTISVRKGPSASADSFTMLLGATLNSDVTANNGSGADDLGMPAATLASFGGGSLAGDATANTAGTSVSLGGGTLTVNANGTVSLATPSTSGTYTFFYRLTNAVGSSDATVTIVVQRPPDAKDDAFTTQSAATLNGNVTSDNGSGADDLGDPAATVTGFGGGSLSGNTTTNAAGASVSLAGGTLTVNGNGTFSLANPTTGGIFTFRYRLANAAGIDSATATITVNAPPSAANDAPASNSVPGDPWHTAFNTALTTPNVMSNDNLGFPAATVTSFGGGTLGGTVTSNAAGSTATVDGHSLVINSDGSLSYTPKTGFTGLFTTSYRLTNAGGTSDATLTIAVGARPTATNSTYGTTLLGNVGINTSTSSNTKVNASGDALVYNNVSQTNGTGSVHVDGTYEFNPSVGFVSGNGTIVFNVSNGFGSSSNATVTLPVGATRIWFVASGGTGDGRYGTPLGCVVGASGCVSNQTLGNGDIVHITAGTYAGTGALPMTSSMKIIGEGATVAFATASGVSWPADAGTQPATAGTRPVLNSSGAGVLTLNAGNTLRGLLIGSSTGVSVSGSAVGSLAMSEAAIVNANGRAIDLTTSGTLAVSVDSVVATGGTGNGINLANQAGSFTSGITRITNPSGTGINIQNSAGFSLGTTIVKKTNAGTGVNLNTNTGTTAFTSLVDSTASGDAFVTSSAGTVSIGGGNIYAVGGSAVNATSTIFTGAGFSSIVTSGGSATGVNLNGTSGTLALGAGSIDGKTDGFRVLGGSSGTVTYSGTIGTSTRPVNVSNAASSACPTLTLSGNISSTSNGILVQNCNAGTLTFSGGSILLKTTTNKGVQLASNTGATIDFTSGALVDSTTTGSAFEVSGGGTVSVTGSGNVLRSTTGTALSVSSTSIGASGLTFKSIAANGAANGILLSNTGSAGGLTVTGNGGTCTVATPTCTGGTIQSTTSNGVSLTNVAKVSLSFMRITASGGSGIKGSVVNGFVLANDIITANGSSAASDDSGIDIANLSGSAIAGANPTSITNTAIQNNREFELQISNNGASVLTDLQMSGNTISSNGLQPDHGNLFNFLSFGTGNMTLNLTSGTFTGNTDISGGKIITATGVQCDHSGTGGIMTCNISGATFTNNNVGPQASVASNGAVVFDFNGNNIQGSRAHGVNIFADANSPYTKSIQGRIRNNTIGTSGDANSGAETGFPIRVQNEGRVNVTLNIDNNDIFESPNAGINLNHGISSANGTGTSALTITNNTITNITGSRGIILNQNDIIGGGTHGTVCVDVRSNVFSGIAGQAGDGSYMRLREGAQTGGTATFNVRQLVPSAAVNASELDDVNGFNDPTKISISGTPTFNAGTCAQPSN